MGLRFEVMRSQRGKEVGLLLTKGEPQLVSRMGWGACGWKECPPSSDKGMLPPTIKGKARRREGDAAGEGKRFRRSRFYFSSKTKKAEDGLRCVLSEGNTLFRPHRGGMIYLIAGPSPRSARRPIGIAAFVACPLYLGPGKRWQQQKGRGPCSASAPFLVNGAAGALAAMAQTKVKRPLAHSSIGHVGCWAAGRLPRVSQFGGPKAGSSPCTGHVAYRISCDTDGNACYER
ncbi:hypothetical protein TSUD_291700 [Trifolium subterraneum]|uniref:Uncharacterized protein n=1 Tax=Trifolium subterraneum TaxID=3900 RepID=A0A2Z6PFJ9_TRISU|nr:hypothetical protein TSUD_291700 [Trifolium subterraneum]